MTTYGHHGSRSRSNSAPKNNTPLLNGSRKRPPPSGHGLGHPNKKSKGVSGGAYETQVIHETQYPGILNRMTRSASRTVLEKAQATHRVESTQSTRQTRLLQTKTNTQSPAFTSSQSQQQQSLMNPPTLPTRGGSRGISSQTSQSHRFSDSSELSCVPSYISSIASRARSSHANNTSSARRTSRAPSTAKRK